MEEPKYRLEPCTQEDAKEFNEALQKLIAEKGVELVAIPVFVQETTSGKFMADAQVKIFKKVLLPDEPEQPTTEEQKFEPEPEA